MEVKLPQGSEDPNNRVLGPKYYNIDGIWALKPYYFGPWTLKVRVQSYRPIRKYVINLKTSVEMAHTSPKPYMSYSLNSLRGVIWGIT